MEAHPTAATDPNAPTDSGAAPERQPLLEIESLSWTYPGVESATEPSGGGVETLQPDAPAAVSDISLTAMPGECVVLCGASGCGKSTLLSLINGVLPNFHERGRLTGSIRMHVEEFGTIANNEVLPEDLGRCIGTVMQRPRTQFFTQTIPEELAFGMENFGFPPTEIRERLADREAALAEYVPLDHPLRQLSGGQQQQVAIAACSAHRPELVLFDEPSANLSADAVERLRETLTQLKARGVTLIIAEHRLEYLSDLVDQVCELSRGRIVRRWTGDEFRALDASALRESGLCSGPTQVELPQLRDAEPDPQGLELHDVHCPRILDVDHLTFPAGRVTAIRGRNGAGKTTLARIIAGLTRASGTVRLAGRRLGPRARQGACAMVMQDVQRQLLSNTVLGEVTLAVKSGVGAAAPTRSESECKAILGELDLGDFLDRHPLSLSGGQQQRLAVAQAAVSDRPVVIFDEPSSGVDQRHLEAISAQLRALADRGAVVLLISHDTELLQQAADLQLQL